MTLAIILTLAMVLDALFGEPRWLWSRVPHPAILMGRVIDYFDRKLNIGTYRRMKGAITITVAAISAGLLGVVITLLPASPIFQTLVVAVLLAHRSLIDHVKDVALALQLSLPDARKSVAKIVGRDTDELDEPAIARAAIESAAENFSDGFVAPAFWFLILGLPGLLIYKITNTADSMIGHKNPKYQEFGWAAARLDDLLNWVPARLTAILIMIAHFRPKAWAIIKRDAALHRSPNAGWPEAAMAANLDVAIAGPRSYDGQLRDFPYVNPEGRHDVAATDIDATIVALWRTWALSLILVVLLAVA